MKNKMNQVQEKKISGDINKSVKINVTALKEPNDGHPGNEIDSTTDSYDNTRGAGINANELFEGPSISEEGHNINTKPMEESTVGQLDLTGEGVNVNKELPKAPKDLNINDAIDVNDTNAETAPEISKEDLVAAEAEMARELERLSNEQAVTSGSADKQEISMPEDSQGSLEVKDKLDQFMNTKNTEMPTGEITAPEKVESVFNGDELDKYVEGVKLARENAEEARERLTEEMLALKIVGEGSAKTLGVGEDTLMGANNRDLKNLQDKISIEESLLEDEIAKLQELINKDPRFLTALRNNAEAAGVPDIQALLDGMEVVPITEAEVVNKEEILPVDTAENIKIVDESTVEVIVSGLLLGAIKDAVSVLTDGGNEEIKIASDMAFHSLIEEKIEQFEETKKFTHKEVYAKVSDLIKNSNKIRVSLEDGKGIVVDILKLKSETKIMPAINAPENLADSVADSYDEQMAA